MCARCSGTHQRPLSPSVRPAFPVSLAPWGPSHRPTALQPGICRVSSSCCRKSQRWGSLNNRIHPPRQVLETGSPRSRPFPRSWRPEVQDPSPPPGPGDQKSKIQPPQVLETGSPRSIPPPSGPGDRKSKIHKCTGLLPLEACLLLRVCVLISSYMQGHLSDEIRAPPNDLILH